MKKRVIPVAIAAVLLICLAACGGADSTAPSTTLPQSTKLSTAATTAKSTTTLPLTTVVQTVTQTETTATTKKETTTAQITTKPVTTKPTTTLPVFDENKPEGYYKIIQNVSRDSLRYGVSRRRNEINYIETLADGTRLVVKQEISEYYNRYNYRASYSDLLPAAKENMNLYSEMIYAELDIINSFRRAKGISPLTLSNELTEIANARAEEIAWSGKHSHTRPNGKKFSSILKDAGITKGTVGENIGWGYGSVEDVCQAWKESESHYKNIMDPEFKKIGIGIAADPDPDKLFCWTQIFM